MPRLNQAQRQDQFSLDDEVQLTHYRLQKLSEQKLDLESGDIIKLPGTTEGGSGAAPPDEQKALKEIVAKMNDLFAGEISESDFIGALTAWSGRLAANEKDAEQATNNSAEQFELGDFKDAFMDVVIDANDAQNSIADQLLKNPRIFGVMQSMMAKMVWQQFQQPRP